MKSKLVYWLTYAGMWLLALLPFRALYILSDGVCFLMRHVVHYRRKVVRKNLKNSFPEKSEAELREIEREFYRYICDYMLEEIKMMRMSFEDLSRRMEYGNTEEYLAMNEEMLEKTDSEYAPWHILESVDKKYARIKALKIVIEELEKVLDTH